MNKMEKVYKVEFMEYTNYSRDTVCDESKKIGHGQYLHVGKEPFLVKESDLEKYKNYGGGYRSVVFVGYLEEIEAEKEEK